MRIVFFFYWAAGIYEVTIGKDAWGKESPYVLTAFWTSSYVNHRASRPTAGAGGTDFVLLFRSADAMIAVGSAGSFRTAGPGQEGKE